MKKLFALLMVVGLTAVVAACGGGGGGDDGGDGCTGSGCSGGGSKTDSSDGTIDMYKNGTIKASFWITVHAEPATGQYWETSSEAYGTKTTNRWQIANVDGTTVIVENQMKMDSEYAMSDYVIAYEVDTSVAMGEVNVKKAWIGKPGEAGTEIQVMEKPEPVADGTTTNYESTTEDFTDVEMAGGKWSGKLTTTKGDGWESKVWVADNGWFGGVIKTEASGMVTQLTAFGTDAKPLLKW
jgi:hypothetical protein